MGCQSLVKFEEKIDWKRSRKKKTHGRNFEIWALILNQRGAIMVGSTLIQWQHSNFKITAVVFFFTAPYFCLRSQNFTVVWLWAAITPVQNLTRPINSTFSESSGRQLSDGPILVFFVLQQISRNKRFMRKGVFLHFCMTAPRKFSKNLQSDNIEVWRLAHSSYRSWCSTVFKTPVEVSDPFKIVGPSPLRSQLIQDHDRQNECF